MAELKPDMTIELEASTTVYGANVGCAVGSSLGDGLGADEGANVPVGAPVVALDGLAVGVDVVGASVGVDVGCAETVGAIEGAP